MGDTDPIRNDSRISHANAREFARLMQRATEGHALWHPSTSGRIGDCGVINGGIFQKVFNVYDRSPGLAQPLSQPTPFDFEPPREDENALALCSAELDSVSFDGQAKLAAGKLPIALAFNLRRSHEESSLAYLHFLGDFRRTDLLGHTKSIELKNYIHEHRSEIRSACSNSSDFVVVYGVTRAAGWVSAVALASGAKVDVSAGASGPSIGAGLAVHKERKENSGLTEGDPPEASAEGGPPVSNVPGLPKIHANAISKKAAPPISNGTAPNVYCDHCVVLQVYEVQWTLRDKIRHSAKVAISGTSNAQGQTSSTPSPSGRSVQVQCKAPTAGTGNQSSSAAGAQESYGASSEGSEDGGPESDEVGIAAETAETVGEGLLSAILARILRANDEIESVLGSWEDIKAFRRDYGELHNDTDFVARLVVDERDNAARIVKLTSMDAIEEYEVEHGHWVDPVPSLSATGALSMHHSSLPRVSDSEFPAELFVEGQYEAVPGLRPIGTGSFGTVEISQPTGPPLGSELRAMHPAAGARVAIKYMRYTADEDKNKEMDRALAKEITLFKRLSNHPNILPVIGLWRDPKTQLGIVSQYADKGVLSTYLTTKPNFFILAKILGDVALALQYLHEYVTDKKQNQVGVAHGDLHPGNILIMSDGAGIKAVLSDFGLYKVVDEHAMTTAALRGDAGIAGLPAYLAPEVYLPGDLGDEVVQQEEQSPEYAGHRTIKSDIFAFAMLSFTTLGGDIGLALFGQKGKLPPIPLAISIAKGNRPKWEHLVLAGYVDADRAAIEAYWPSIEKGWQHNAAERPAIEQVRDKIPRAEVLE